MTQRSLVASGFSLLEVTLALGVAAVSILAIFGLLTTGTKVNYTSTEQSSSSDILTAIAGDLRATPKTTPLGGAATSPFYSISIPPNPVTSSPTPTTLYFNSQGQFATTLQTNSRYRLVVTFLPNGTGTRTATFVNLRLTWPAAATPSAISTDSAETFVALDRN